MRMTANKLCTTCGLEKDLVEFGRNQSKGKLFGHRNKCRECRKVEHKKWTQTPEWRARNRHWKRAQYAKRKRNPDAFLEFQIRQCGYSITVSQYREMEEKQLGLCALCGGTNKDGKRLFVDHDHKTGVVRGLLCKSCNAAIGMLCDRVPDWLNRVTEYLRGQ